MTDQLDELRAAADKAIAAQTKSVDCLVIEYHQFATEAIDADAEFRRRAHPEIILAILAENAKLNQLLESSAKIMIAEVDQVRKDCAKEVTDAMDERNFAQQDCEAFAAENKRLREALKPFADAYVDDRLSADSYVDVTAIRHSDLRNAAKAIKETPK